MIDPRQVALKRSCVDVFRRPKPSCFRQPSTSGNVAD